MKNMFLVALLISSTVSFAGVPSLKSVRSLYQKAAINEKSCKNLIEILSPYNNNTNPLLQGYNGCATMMMAKYTLNPFSKWSYFQKGKKMLENAIGADSTNIELRFLRFAVQTNIPSFLGYHGFIESDKKILLESISFLNDPELKNMITVYFRNCKCLTALENNL